MAEIRYEKVLVTPEMAREILKNNPSNRTMVNTKIKQYAFDMGRNAWRDDTAEPIKLTENGRLVDGQHRLSAVILADKSVPFVFAYNVSLEAMKIIDTGLKRTNADMFQIRGIDNAPLLSSVIRKYLVYTGTKNYDPRSATVPYDIIEKEYDESPEKWQNIVRAVKSFTKNFKYVEPSILGAWYALCSDISQEDANFFFDRLSSGVGLEEKNPILILRNLMIAGKYAELSVKIRYIYFIKTWNYFREKKMVSVLRYSTSDEVTTFK